MMKAWAAFSAAAVLVALPLSVQQAAGAVVESDPAATSADMPALGASASDLGVVVWLSVALVAAIAAFVVLRRSRTQLAAAGDPAELLFPALGVLPATGPTDLRGPGVPAASLGSIAPSTFGAASGLPSANASAAAGR